MNLAEHYAATLGKSVDEIMRSAAFLLSDGTWSLIHWDEAALGPAPSEDDLAAVAALPEPAPTAAVLTAYAAAARYAKETGGITVGTAPIATDRGSQALITGMWAAAQINPQIAVSFKSGAGFVKIGADQVGKIAGAVAAHVQGCFSTEAQVVQDIGSGKVKTTADVDAAFAAAPSTFGASAAGASS